MKTMAWVLAAAWAVAAQTGLGGLALDRKAMQTAYEEGRRAELRVSLESQVGSPSLNPSDRGEYLRYLSALYGDDGAKGKAASCMLQLARLEPQRESLGLQVKPSTDSMFRSVREEYATWRTTPEGKLHLQPLRSPPSGESRSRAIPWLAGAVVCVAAGAAMVALAWP